jgi:hypothetical protein
MYTINKDKVFCDINNDLAIIINSDTGIYYSLNVFGTKVFQNIIAGVSTNDIGKDLKKLSNCPADIEDKLKKFTDTLIEKEIIIEGKSDGDKVVITEQDAIEQNFGFGFEEYADMQEMLLIDPIHDVSDEGWKVD